MAGIYLHQAVYYILFAAALLSAALQVYDLRRTKRQLEEQDRREQEKSNHHTRTPQPLIVRCGVRPVFTPGLQIGPPENPVSRHDHGNKKRRSTQLRPGTGCSMNFSGNKKQSVHYRILRSYKDTLHGRSVIIGFQKTQIYQRFAGSQQEVFILKIQNDENNAAQQENRRRVHINC